MAYADRHVMRALSLFTGYGGIDLALENYVRPIMYCEIEKYCQGIILSRMDDETLPFAPIWDDVTTMDGAKFRGLVDIVYGGFPCQDISVAGKGKGLDGKRSGLFFEVIRICKESSPLFIFLENVPAIRTRGAVEVAETLANIGYDCRWHHLSAAEVGANHKRERWFLLAHSRNHGHGKQVQSVSQFGFKDSTNAGSHGEIQSLADTSSTGSQECDTSAFSNESGHCSRGVAKNRDHWQIEPDVGRVVDGVTLRNNRIKSLGNGVVPLQVKTAFEILMGIKK